MFNFEKILIVLAVILHSNILAATSTDNNSLFINLDSLEEPARSHILKTQIFTPQELVDPLYQLAKDVTEVLEETQIDYWIAFGTFMGAIRNAKFYKDTKELERPGGLFKWDDDLDYGIKKADIPKLETLKEKLSSMGYNLFADELVGYKIYSTQSVFLADETEKTIPVYPFLDIFVFEEEEDKYVLSSKRGREFFKNGWFFKNQIEEKVRYKFGPIDVWGPSNPSDYFIRNYGPEWQTKALFSWVHYRSIPQKYLWILTEETLQPALPSKPLLNRVKKDSVPQIPEKLEKDFYVKSVDDNLVYWENAYYKNEMIPYNPSSFCLFLTSTLYLSPKGKLLDMGCGNGRDTFELAKYMTYTVGIDASQEVIKKNNEKAKILEGYSLSFAPVLINSPDTLTHYKDFDYIYARFFMHAIDEKTQDIVMDFFSALKAGSKLFLEFRTIKDPLFVQSKKISNTEGIHTHYRRFIDYENFISSLERLNFKIDYQIEAQDLSFHAGDNPYLARIVAQKKE